MADDNDELIVDDPNTEGDDQLPEADDPAPDSPPEEPVARAAYFEKKATDEAKARAELARDNKRLQETVEEKEFKSTTWFTRAKELEAELESRRAGSSGRSNQPPADDADVEELDLAELVTAEDGGKRIKQLIRDEAEKIAARTARQQIEGTLTEVSQDYRVRNQFKELTDPESEFAKAVFAEKDAMKRDPMYAGMTDAAMTELAARHVRDQIPADTKGKGDSKRDAAAEEDRAASIRRAGSPSTRKPQARGTAPTINPRFVAQGRQIGLTDEEIRDAYSDKSVRGWSPGQP